MPIFHNCEKFISVKWPCKNITFINTSKNKPSWKYAITGHFLDGQTGNNQLLTRNRELVQRNSCVQSEHKHEIIQQIPKHTSHTHKSKIWTPNIAKKNMW